MLALQSECFNNIKTLCINYKKDSSSRKTEEYLKKRLSSLEEQWIDFEARHGELTNNIDEKNIDYFNEDIYGRTKTLYLDTKSDIITRLKYLEEQKQVKFDLSEILETENEKLQMLLNNQECNFKAIDRAMSKMNATTTSEKWELEENLALLKKKWEYIDKSHWEIDLHLKGSNETYYQMFLDIEHKYDELRKAINNKLWSMVHYQQSAPKIVIPEFSGNYAQWTSFKDLFIETIHNNPGISKAQKMQHLKTKLKGEAERLVQHLTTSAENYVSCWEILTQRYDNHRLQFTYLMNNMLNIPNIINPDAYNLKKLHDVTTECMNGISNIGIDTSSWDPIIVHLMSQKLDSSTFNDYIKDLHDPKELQPLRDFLFFIESKFLAYETMKTSKSTVISSQKSTFQKSINKPFATRKYNFDFKKQNMTKSYHVTYTSCPYCDEDHVLRTCPKFINMNSFQRNSVVAKLQLCKNCLYSHGESQCTSTKTCRECNMKHHTLLHNYNTKTSGKTNNNTNQPSTSDSQPSTSNQMTAHHLSTSDEEILLTTVQLKIKSADGTLLRFRALLDQGSQVNLITENAAQLLRLQRKNLNATISGVGSVSGDCKGRLHLTCQSIHSNFTFETDALIMKKLTRDLPNCSFKKGDWPHLENLKLADPEFNISGTIDLLLGADVYSEILLNGVLRGQQQSPVAQQTQLGWILCGRMKTFNCYATVINLDELTRFWESEDIYSEVAPKDDYCEEHYKKTVRRGPDGKYIVSMPFIPKMEEKLGNSRTIAVSQFLQLERKLERNQKLSAMYRDFIREYQELGHMKPAASSSHITTSSSAACYLPHHGVLRESSTTTKLRVVFNASQKTDNGHSLNSILEKGPNLQTDIQALILKWRTYEFAYTADIEKMYRCIWLCEQQQHLQRIIWRDTRQGRLIDYQLCTVTYGINCAPWLAMRTLKQLAMDEAHNYPTAAKVLQGQFYVDDLVCGQHSLEEAQQLQQSLIQLLRAGGMNLRKWSSNCPALLENLNEDQISKQQTFDFKGGESMKTLGLGWNPNNDTFSFEWPLSNNSTSTLTKRTLLSEISKLWDPCGWISPITVTAKLIFQQVWTIKGLSWNSEVPEDIKLQWLSLKNERDYLKSLTLPRWVGSKQDTIDLLGFSDASTRAFSCVIYSRVWKENGKPEITLLIARTRVAPLARQTSLPRLELCGAELLADTMKKIQESLSEYNTTVQAWSDSQVVLAWLKGETSRWNAYVARRVTKIKEIIPAAEWHYVKSEENPADCASRGLLPSKLANFHLWWQGPSFLRQPILQQQKETEITCTEITLESNMGLVNHVSKTCLNTKKIELHFINELLVNCSSLTRIKRVTAWTMRFINKLRNKMKYNTTYLTANELNEAYDSIIIQVQRSDFASEYNQLLNNEIVSSKSPTYKLSPYLDPKGLIRVGGRLKNSDLSPEMKNPVILPHHSRLTKLVIEHAHKATLHGGARLTLAYLRQRHWIIGGNRAVKTQLRHCIRCHRNKRVETCQLMGNLPKQRSTPSRPFTHTGVDFTGNVDIKLHKGRGVKTSKAYIAIFICMATKAIHMELVSDLSSEAFIAAFHRMCSRRGTPKHMYSDCGTNFVGAVKMLRKEFEEFKQTILTTEFFNEISELEVEWHLNCPAWASAGGLWESAVKAMKHHLRRVLGDQKLTYEEFLTLLTKIEACLNSRPLCPLTEDPEEFYNYLTPGHFLTGSPTLTLPLADYGELQNIDIRKRWQLTEHMLHQFWKNWSNDYLSQLQIKSKWNKPSKNIKEGDIVLVKADNLPPGKWAMGRVMKTHPGTDGLVRVTTIKTQAGTIKRPIVKLSPLPIETEITSTADSIEKPPPPKDHHLQRTVKTSNKTCATLLLTLLSLFTFTTESYGSDLTRSSAQITSLEKDRPIYYDTVGRIQITHDEWWLVMYYNLTNYWEGTRRAETYLTNISGICELTQLMPCKTVLEQLRHELDFLHYYNTILLAPHKHLSNRKKRGFFNGVGYLANSLFGILDQNFAEKYKQDIDAINNNEDYLLKLVKNQTTIVELENKVLKKNEDNIKRQFSLIDAFINQTNVDLEGMRSKIDLTTASTFMNSAAMTAHLLISRLKEVQEMLFNTLTSVYQGHIDVHLITPVTLIKQLENIAGKLPRTMSLPIENIKEDIKELYKLLYVKARVTDTYFLFEIHIPLISDEEFTLYHPIPLPIKTKKGRAEYLELEAKYIAVNFKKNIFISISEDELRLCSQLQTDNLICQRSLPVSDLHSNNAPCEAKMLSHTSNSPCDAQRIPCKDAWIQLHERNSWLVICCNTCILRTICDYNVTPYTMTSSGIVNLKQGCVLQADDLTIHSYNHYNSRMTVDYNFDVPALNMSINNIVKKQQPIPLNYSSTSGDIEEIAEMIANQKDHETNMHTSPSTHDVHLYAISYTMVACTVTAVICWVGRKYWPFSCQKKKTTKKSENSNPQNEDIEMQIMSQPRSRRLPTGSSADEHREESRHRVDFNPAPPTASGVQNISFNFD